MLETEKTYLSIVIPHYNSVKLLKKLLSTIPDRKEVQIIIVDDNSTENLEELEEIVQSRREQILFLKNESGKNSAGRCRNIGMAKAEGKWLLFADADDYFTPDFYDTLLPYFESDYDIVWFVPTSWNLDTREVSNRHLRYQKLVENFLTEQSQTAEVKLRYMEESPCSKIVRRSLVTEQNIQFDEIMVANDIMFSVRCAYAAERVAASEKVIYCMTKQQGTLTTAVNKEKFYVRFGVFLDKYHFLKERLSSKEWHMLDLLGRPYIKLAKNYGLDKKEIRSVYFTMLKKGIRIDVSRKWTPGYVIKKIGTRFSEGLKRK